MAAAEAWNSKSNSMAIADPAANELTGPTFGPPVTQLQAELMQAITSPD